MAIRSMGSRVSSVVAMSAGLVVLAACGIADARRSSATRETLANGAVLVTYSALPDLPVDSLVLDLRIGKIDGEPWETFGSIRALEVGPEGTIYVLDSQASEVRAFNASGAYVGTLARRGEGPGEIGQANGMTLGGDGTLWVNDFSSRSIIGLSSDGREVARHPMMVTGFGAEWDGVIDRNGVIRQTWAFRAEASGSPPSPGLHEDRRNVFLKAFDTRSLSYDSTYVGLQVSRVLRIIEERTGVQIAVPHEPRRLSVIDRSGNLWTATSDSYRIARMTAAGDTTLILEVPLQGPLVTAEDLESAEALFERAGASAPLAERKPVLARLIVDDEGRLWVRRGPATNDELPLLDAFSPDGELLGHVRLPLGTTTNSMAVIRGGHIYAITRDELDVSYVIRAPLPAFAWR